MYWRTRGRAREREREGGDGGIVGAVWSWQSFEDHSSERKGGPGNGDRARVRMLLRAESGAEKSQSESGWRRDKKKEKKVGFRMELKTTGISQAGLFLAYGLSKDYNVQSEYLIHAWIWLLKVGDMWGFLKDKVSNFLRFETKAVCDHQGAPYISNWTVYCFFFKSKKLINGWNVHEIKSIFRWWLTVEKGLQPVEAVRKICIFQRLFYFIFFTNIHICCY